jgi:hypothetical protein
MNRSLGRAFFTGDIMELLSPAFVFSLSLVGIVFVTVLSLTQRSE